jgi:excinuclease ABC subunit C
LPVDKRWYAAQVESVAKFLDGRHDELSRELEAEMKKAAHETRYELAAAYRDQLRAIEKVRAEQRVVTVDDRDRDVIGLYREGELVEIAILLVRRGRLADVATYSIKRAEVPDDEVVGAFLAQHYGASLAKSAEGEAEVLAVLVADEVILPIAPEGLQGIAEWLGDRAGHKVALMVPKRGHRVDLLSMANDNARHSFSEKQRQADDVEERLRDLQKRLRLPVLPRRIEGCDISHLGGGDTVGAVVAMTDGELDKKRYRTFKVRGGMANESPDLNDDYGSMYEVLARRFRRAASSRSKSAETLAERGDETGGGESDWDAPDLFVVDGGRGQLAVALAAANDLGIHDLPIVALAKERELGSGDVQVDRVYLPGQKNPIPLNSGTTSLFLLARLRDEAHRFSNRGRSQIGKKRRFHSPLDDIKGLGPTIKKALQRHVGNLAAIREADDATLLAVPGVRPRHVKALRSAFSGAAEDAAPSRGSR